MEEKMIMLVEDNPADVLLTKRALKKANISDDLVVMRDGVEALYYLVGAETGKAPASARLPTVMLLDLKMPRIDGLEVLRRVRKNPRTKLLPVVVLTSSREERDIIASYELGCNSYIRKPIDFTQFADAICHLGQYWLCLNETPSSPGET